MANPHTSTTKRLTLADFVKRVPGHDAYVTTSGLIWDNVTGGLAAQSTTRVGYKVVHLLLTQAQRFALDKRAHTYNVHALVARAFLPPMPGKDSVDHYDRNKANNDVRNLRWADAIDQAQNRAGRTSQYVGVSYVRKGGRWTAAITLPLGLRRHLGTFATEREAAVAYNTAARLYRLPVRNILLEHPQTSSPTRP